MPTLSIRECQWSARRTRKEPIRRYYHKWAWLRNSREWSNGRRDVCARPNEQRARDTDHPLVGTAARTDWQVPSEFGHVLADNGEIAVGKLKNVGA